MKRLILILFIIQTVCLTAQTVYTPKIPSDSSFLLIADDVNIRSAPNLNSQVINNLPIGTEVKLVRICDENLTLRGLTADWFEIKFNGQKQRAYLWSALLAENYAISYKDSCTYLLGVDNTNEHLNDSLAYKYQIRTAKNNEQISIKTISIKEKPLSINIFSLGDKGLKSVTNVLMVDFIISDIETIRHYYFIKGIKCEFARSIRLSENPNGNFFNEELIFPEDKDGKSGIILHITESGTNNGNSIKYDIRQITSLVWTGDLLKQVFTTPFNGRIE